MKAAVRCAGIDVVLVYLAPARPGTANACALMRRKNHETHSLVYQRGDDAVIAGSLGQPNGFGLTFEAMTKIRQTPANLRAQIAFVAQGEDRMTVGLRDGIAMPIALPRAVAISVDNLLVSFAIVLFQPAQQGWAKVEANKCVVVDD